MGQTNFLSIFAPNFLSKVKTWLTGKYVEDEDTASQNIPVGKWVIWKGQMCQTKTAITTGDTLSSANLDVQDDDGAVNALNSNLKTYTESEQVIGTWIDGKPLYRKSKVIRNVSTTPVNIAMELSNIDLFVNVSMMLRDSTSSHNWRPIPWTFNAEMAAWSGGFYITSSGTLCMQLGTSLDDADTVVIIIEYTKTTDTATITT